MSALEVALGWLLVLAITLIGTWVAGRRYKGITDFDFGDIEDI